MSQGYVSLLGSMKIESLPDVSMTTRHNVVDEDWHGATKCTPQHEVSSSSAPDIILINSANEPHRKSVTSDKRHSDDQPAAATWSWDATEDDTVDLEMPLMLQQIKAEVALHHRQTSERSASTHERRRSLRSASVSSADPQARLLATGRGVRADSTVAELEDERNRALLEELNIDTDPDDNGSYIPSRASSYTDSLPVDNRVCVPSTSYILLTLLLREPFILRCLFSC